MGTVSLSDYFPLPEGAEQYPLEFIENKQALKLRETDEAVVVGLVDSQDILLKNELAFFHKKPVDFQAISPQELAEYLSKAVSDYRREPEASADEKVLLDKLANDAPIVNLVNSILLEGIRLACSDIHIESFENSVVVRYRIDGVLQTGRRVNTDLFPGISSRIKIMSDLNIIERRLPQDGRMSVSLSNKEMEFRVSIVPVQDGESIVLRLFQKKDDVKGLEDLRLSPFYRDTLRTLGKFPNGLVLVTGPTGSGKTTTLNALLKELNSDTVKIITIEDPVENVIEGVNQVQTNETIGLTFESILRRLLRQDPDILMVGEIRDRKTAELAIRSALTGHLVLSTLHTNDALSTIPRLLNMGVESYLLAGVLRGVSAQRLVRRVCPHCSAARTPTALEKKFLARNGLNLEKLQEGQGCKECHQSGFLGRVVIGEIFPMDENTEELIIQDRKKRDFEAYFEKKGTPFLLQDGLEKIRVGETTVAEIERAVIL